MSAGPLLASRAIGRASSAVALGTSVVVWLVLLGPLVVLVQHISPGAIRSDLRLTDPLAPLWISLGASAIALACMTLLGTPLAWLLARGRLPLPGLVEAGIVLPLLMPPLVVGLLLIFLIGPASPIGGALAHLGPGVFGVNTFFALVVAEFYEAAPFYILSAAAAFASVDPRLERDAQLLGDRPLAAFRKITVPLAAPGLAAGLAIAWARAMGAFGAVLIVAYNPAGLPLEIDNQFIQSGLPAALPYALLLVIAALPLPLLGLLWSARTRSRGAPA